MRSIHKILETPYQPKHPVSKSIDVLAEQIATWLAKVLKLQTIIIPINLWSHVTKAILLHKLSHVNSWLLHVLIF